MDMNKEENMQYVTMKQLSYADIEPAAYETPFTPTAEVARGKTSACVSRLHADEGLNSIMKVCLIPFLDYFHK